ncbi:MAG: aminoglycoside phosphotransferase family protein [Chloroflexota bacterium]|nr:aminoglycoside phosphotransferase family protein [Chloroflexota bacterium]
MNPRDFSPCVVDYLAQAALSDVPGWRMGAPFTVAPLAQGEYNMNYLVRQENGAWVLRVNVGTQIGRADQILYEYRALRLLEPTGVTPPPFYVDDSRERLEYGVLLMEYLPGEALDYRRDLEAAACLFARVHTQPVAPEENHLIREERPLSMTYEECSRLLPVYLESDLAEPALRDCLREVLDWAAGARHREAYFLADPWPCIINTEVNSGNFVVNREQGTIHLVDWEKPLWGDPSQDLSHFRVPTTTLWKSDYRMTDENKRAFLNSYRTAISDTHLRDTIEERVRLRDPFNCLRGISWSAMAWVAYQTGEHALRNEDTFRKVSAYLNLGFVRSLFDSYLK